jgi:hypothetical protein
MERHAVKRMTGSEPVVESKKTAAASPAVSSIGFALYGFLGWVVIPGVISGAYLALRSLLPLGPNQHLPTDFLGAGLGLATIGLLFTSPGALIAGAAVGAGLGKRPADPARHRRLRLLFLLGPSIGFGAMGLLGTLASALGQAFP